MAISFSLTIWTIIFGSTINVVTCSIELDFRVIPSVVQPLETKNVTLQCVVNIKAQYHHNQQSNSYYYNHHNRQYLPVAYSPSADDSRSGLDTIRILKNFQNSWRVIAHISRITSNVIHTLDDTIDIVGGLVSDDVTRKSFIKIMWKEASSDVFGSYRCDSISYDTSQNAILTKSSELALGSTLNAQDFLRLLKHDLTDIRKTVGHQEQHQESDHEKIQLLESRLGALEEQTEKREKELEGNVSEQGERLHARIEKMEKRIHDMEREITKKIEEVASKVNIALDSGFLMLWPRGNYGLLQPDTGCSFGGITKWESGWVRHHTESTDRNRDELSAEAHLRKPTLERESGNNFVTQHFCIKADSSSLGPNWPRGSYCINKKENCPGLFDEGYMKWDEENNNTNAQTFGGSVPDGISNGTQITTIEYCCRQDGPAEEPIYLPNSDPFYLYRHGGNCQQVHGMNVTEEFILFDTENTDNKDEFGTAHPDGKINNIRLELCYYRRV